MMGKLTRSILLGCVMAGASVPAALADWLVTSDGSEIETKGPWQVTGKQVVFTTVGGRLASLRLSVCDLDASTALTEERSKARPAAVEPPPWERKIPRRVLVLTDDDVAHVEPTPKPEPREGRERSEVPAPPADGEVAIRDWRPVEEENGIALRGAVRNDTGDVAGRVKVIAVFRDHDGDAIDSRPASLSTSTLKPGQTAEFVVQSFGLFSYASVDFEVRHFTLLTGASESADTDSGR